MRARTLLVPGCDTLIGMRSQSLLDQCLCTPGSFAGLMAIYEQNYRHIKELLNHSEKPPQPFVSRIPHHLPLRLEVLERCRYTTTVSLTYLFREAGAAHTDPDVIVRLYHDAEVAEVLGFGELPAAPQRAAVQPVDAWVLERKWHVNRFLEKWLEYCLACGHRLHP